MLIRSAMWSIVFATALPVRRHSQSYPPRVVGKGIGQGLREGVRLLAVSACLCVAPAHAGTVWAGIYQHDVTIAQIPFENGQDIKAGWIGNPLRGLSVIGAPSPHVLVSKSLRGQTDYVAAGLNWRFGSTVYARPGIGLAIHDGPSYAVRRGQRVDLGSRVTFEPELALGWRVAPRLALEASWIHLSHATLFSRQNRGMDSMGLRVLLDLP